MIMKQLLQSQFAPEPIDCIGLAEFVLLAMLSIHLPILARARELPTRSLRNSKCKLDSIFDIFNYKFQFQFQFSRVNEIVATPAPIAIVDRLAQPLPG